MTLKTVPVTGILYNPDGSVSVGTAVVATLTVMDTDGGVVVPTQVSATTDSTGLFTLNLWPNSRGVNGSQYRVRANVPGALPGVLLLNVLITVPDSDPATPVPIATITNRVGPAVLSDAVAAMLAAQAYALQASGSVGSAAADAAAAHADRLLADADVVSANASAGAAATSVNQAKAAVAYVYPGIYNPASPPTTRPDGNAVQVGDYALFTDNLSRRWNGTIWVASDINTANLAAPSGSTLIGTLQTGAGAVARTVQSRFADWINVKDFGAIGDGTNHPLSAYYGTLAAAQAVYPFVTSLTQSVDWAAFTAAVNAAGAAANSHYAGTIYIAAGVYCLSQEWQIGKSLVIQGAGAGPYDPKFGTKLLFPADSNGVHVMGAAETGTTYVGDFSCIRDLAVMASAKNVSGVGIYCSATARIENVHVEGFKSHGIHFSGITGTSNCDAWKVVACQSVNNGGHGLYLQGSDAQIGICQLTRFYGNSGWGLRDESSYHNAYTEVQCEANTTGNFYCHNGSVFISCYSEAGYGASDFGGSALVIGGNIDFFGSLGNPASAPIYNNFGGCDGWIMPAGRVWVWRAVTVPGTSTSVELARLDSSSNFTLNNGGQYYAKDLTNPGTVYGRLGGGYIALHNDLTTSDSYPATFSNANGQVGAIRTNGSATAYLTSSDYRLKDNVLPMTGALDRILKLKPCTYKWKADGTDGEGFIAHELQEVFPQAVSGAKDETREEDVFEDVALTPEEIAQLPKAEQANAASLTKRVKTGTRTVPAYQGIDTSFLVGALTAALQDLSAKFDAYVAAHP